MTEVFPSSAVASALGVAVVRSVVRVTFFFLFVTFPSLFSSFEAIIVSSSVSFLFPPLEGLMVVVVVAFIG